MSSPRHPKRRSTDRGWRHLLQARWLRDVWLFVVSAIALYGVAVAVDNTSDLAKARVQTMVQECRDTNQRHDQTLVALRELYAAPGGGTQQHLVEAMAAFTRLLPGGQAAHRDPRDVNQVIVNLQAFARDSKAQQATSFQGLTAVVDALAPKRDCKIYARQLASVKS